MFRNWGAGIHEAVFIDASLHGLGAVKDDQFYSTALPHYIFKENRIVVFEMLNILVSLNMWGREGTDKHIEIHCDNRAVVDIMERHKTKDDRLGNILRDILFVMADLTTNNKYQQQVCVIIK